jgi:hypothetical protein
MTLICLIMVYLFIFLTWGPVSLRLTTGLDMGKEKEASMFMQYVIPWC